MTFPVRPYEYVARKMAHKYKAPPEMRDGLLYSDWKKEVSIWTNVTDLDAKKQGGALYLSLSGKARDTVLTEVSGDDMKKDTGVKLITDCLDKLFLKDKTESAFVTFESFMKFKRTASMSIKDYTVEFNLRLKRLTAKDINLPDEVVAYYLLECANLSKEQSSLCRATCANLTYVDMKAQIERVMVRPSSDSSNDSNDRGDSVIPQYVAQSGYDHPDQYYFEPQPGAQGFSETDYPIGQDGSDYGVEEPEDAAYYTRPGSKPYTAYTPPHRGKQRYDATGTRKKNPLDDAGQVTSCRHCKSIFHWVDDCPELKRSSAYNARGRGQGYGYGYRGRGRGNPNYKSGAGDGRNYQF